MGKRKTPEDYRELADEIGWRFVGPYPGNVREKTQWICNHGHQVSISYDNLRRGKGCRVCSRAAVSRKQRLQPARYNEIAKIAGLIWLGPEVPNTQTKTWWKCKNGHKFDTTYNSISNRAGNGCRYCAGNVKKVSVDYRELGKSRGLIWGGTEPKSTSEKTLWICKNKHRFNASWDSIKGGSGCPHCAAQKLSELFRHSEDVYIEFAKKMEIEFIGPLPENSTMPTKWRCACGTVWEATYHGNRGRCPGCGYRAMVESRSRVSERGYVEIGKLKRLRYDGPYPGNVKEKTNWTCEFGHKVHASYDAIRSYQSCPVCAETSGEFTIRHALRSWHISFKRQKTFAKCRDKSPLRFDFYANVPSLAGPVYFLIEYDGIQHFEPLPHWGGEEALQATRRRDRIKTKFAERHNIPLIRINYTQKKRLRQVLRDEIIRATGVDPLDICPPVHTQGEQASPVDPAAYRQARLF